MHLVFMIYSWDRTFIYVSLKIHGHKIFYPFFSKKRILLMAYGYLYQILFWFTYGRHKSGTMQYYYWQASQ